MKRLIVKACFCLALPLALRAQQSEVVFGYDASGNRVSRTISVYKIAKNDSTQKQTTASEAVENFMLQKIEVYPNPTDGLVNIAFKLPLEGKCIYTLTSISGSLIEQGDISSTLTRLNLQHLGKGTYLLSVATPQIKEKFKIVKQ
mgnify:CR=1 FL=1